MLRNINLDLQFQPYVSMPKENSKSLYQESCRNDELTLKTWKKTWIENTKKNQATHGPFSANGVGQLYNRVKNQPCLVVGSGPSLKYNVEEMKDTKGIPVVSCLHNFHYLEDHGVKVDYYVTLDAGIVTLEEISEGGTKTPEEYLELTKDKTLVAFIGSSPKLIEAWRGKILWYNCPIPETEILDAMTSVENFGTYISTGGNVLGAAFYLAKAILGANPVIFTGADFSFSYDNKFHPWDSKYDAELGNVLRVRDIFGIPVNTWQSYLGFQRWFVSSFMRVPGIYINASEGGILGAFDEGNVDCIRQMALKDVLQQYSINEPIKDQCQNPGTGERLVLF